MMDTNGLACHELVGWLELPHVVLGEGLDEKHLQTIPIPLNPMIVVHIDCMSWQLTNPGCMWKQE